MKTQKLLLKTAYCLAGLLILVSIGFNIFQYQRNKRLSEKSVPEKITKNEFVSHSINDSISDSESAPVKMVQKSTASVSEEEKSSTSKRGRWFRSNLTVEYIKGILTSCPDNKDLDTPGALYHVMGRGIDGLAVSEKLTKIEKYT